MAMKPNVIRRLLGCVFGKSVEGPAIPGGEPVETAEPTTHLPTTILYARFAPEVLMEDSPRDALEFVSDPLPNMADSVGNHVSHPNSPGVSLNKSSKRLGKSFSKNRKREIRFARLFSEMSPVDARILFHIHRRSVRSIAAESPVALLRDIQRFALSSRGQRILRGTVVPEITRVRAWVREAKQLAPVLGQQAAKRVLNLTA